MVVKYIWFINSKFNHKRYSCINTEVFVIFRCSDSKFKSNGLPSKYNIPGVLPNNDTSEKSKT